MEDQLLILKFCAGSRKALQRIYEKYVNELLTLASSLLGDINSAVSYTHLTLPTILLV